ncbi:uncharacterized protein LOC117647171 isoform X3 [Thrips palmi]|uniref:Uncharacterized protein LOC117647171 isoform X3 n=1 Tax=Thrips palmi TaxID=161013 RepID=A0A6P8Z4G6_THRPL|nr:uncharacterized protein LOC117647171 isoform X3 [Thrips palmi]
MLRQRQFLLHDMYRKCSEVNGACVLLMAVYTLTMLNVFYIDSRSPHNLTVAAYHGVAMALVVVVISVCQWPATEFQALAKELKSLHVKHRQVFGPLADNELQWLLTCIEQCQDNRFNMIGISYCDRESVTGMLLSACMYFFTCKLHEFK